MGASRRVSAAREAVMDLLADAYERRDRVALVSFRGDSASVVLAPTASIELAQMRLKGLRTGGATPLAAGILTSLDLLEKERRKNTAMVPWLVIITDGQANVGISGGLGSGDAMSAARRVASLHVHALVVDASDAGGLGRPAKQLATAAGADYILLGDKGHEILAELLTRTARA